MTLKDYEDIVGAAAGLVTFAQMFSGVFLCKDIYKNGSTNKISVMPFLGGLVISLLFYQHALLIGDFNMIVVNLGGIGLNFLYLIFYYMWTQTNQRYKLYKNVLKGGSLVVILEIYTLIENPEKLEFRFGMIVTILLLFLIASPLFSLGKVIETQSTESLPFPMIVSGFVVSAHWLAYGIIINNGFVIFQNAVGCVLCLTQLSLFIIFPGKAKQK